MREVGGALFHRPVLHGDGNRIGDGRVERRALLDRFLEGLEDRLGQARPLLSLIEDIDAKQVGNVGRLEIDAVKLVLGSGDSHDRRLANRRHEGLLNIKAQKLSDHQPKCWW